MRLRQIHFTPFFKTNFRAITYGVYLTWGYFSSIKKNNRWAYFPVDQKHIAKGPLFTSEDNKLRSITEDGKGNLYLGTANGKFLYFDQIQKEYKIFTDEYLGTQGASISGLAWRDNRYIYTCVENKEFLLFDTKTKDFIRFDNDEKIDIRPFSLSRHGSEVAICSKYLGLFIQNENQIYGTRDAFPSAKTICPNASQTSFLLEKSDGTIEIRSLSEPNAKGIIVNGVSGILSIAPLSTSDFIVASESGIHIIYKNGNLKKLPNVVNDTKLRITSFGKSIYAYHEEYGLYEFDQDIESLETSGPEECSIKKTLVG